MTVAFKALLNHFGMPLEHTQSNVVLSINTFTKIAPAIARLFANKLASGINVTLNTNTFNKIAPAIARLFANKFASGIQIVGNAI